MYAVKIRLIIAGCIVILISMILIIVRGLEIPFIVILVLGIVVLVIGLIWTLKTKPSNNITKIKNA